MTTGNGREAMVIAPISDEIMSIPGEMASFTGTIGQRH